MCKGTTKRGLDFFEMTVNRNLYLKSAEVSDGNEEHDIEK
jgi:hypothetical protein